MVPMDVILVMMADLLQTYPGKIQVPKFLGLLIWICGTSVFHRNQEEHSRMRRIDYIFDRTLHIVNLLPLLQLLTAFLTLNNNGAKKHVFNYLSSIDSFKEGLDLVQEAIGRTGYNERIKIAIDVAATNFCMGERDKFPE